jgi:hypothetical protein
MRKIFYILIAGSLLAGAWRFFTTNDQVIGFVQQYVENGEFMTFKARYTPEQIMESHRKELLVDDRHTYQAAEIKYHPYILLDVKYSQPDKKTREGMIFWSLVDGEMVLHTDTWEQTHGFEDAINANATRLDFKLMYALAKHKGSATFDQLKKELHLENDTLQTWINSALAKHLVIQKGGEIQLHFQDPKILVQPETKINDDLVKKPYNYAQRVSRKYSNSQIQKTAQAAFGDDFTVRNTTEVFLPVYSIEVLNPDGSVFTSYWNAINGHRIPLRL